MTPDVKAAVDLVKKSESASAFEVSPILGNARMVGSEISKLLTSDKSSGGYVVIVAKR